MKSMLLEKCDKYYVKLATVVKKFQVSLTNLRTPDGIMWNDGTLFAI